MKKKKYLIGFLFLVFGLASFISFKGEKKIVEKMSQEISLSELREDYINRLNYTLNILTEGSAEFPLHDMILLHQNRMLTLKVKGYSTAFYEKIYKQWFRDRFGIDLESDRISKVGKTYTLNIKNFHEEKLVFFENENEIQFFIDRQESPSSMKLRPNIRCPKSKNNNYKLVYKVANPIQITPVNHGK